jgi:hypothetical protein
MYPNLTFGNGAFCKLLSISVFKIGLLPNVFHVYILPSSCKKLLTFTVAGIGNHLYRLICLGRVWEADCDVKMIWGAERNVPQNA